MDQFISGLLLGTSKAKAKTARQLALENRLAEGRNQPDWDELRGDMPAELGLGPRPK